MTESFAWSDLYARLGDLLAPSLAQDEPNLPVERAEGLYFYGSDGRHYMDFISGMACCNLGHNHPRVVEAARRQMERLIQGPIGVVAYEPILRLADELSRVLPGGLDMFFFGNSGAEAVEGSIKLARYVTGRPGVIAFLGGFHGRTMGAASVTTSKGKYRRHYEPFLPAVYFVHFPNPFRDGGPEQAMARTFGEIQRLFDRVIAPDEVACFLVEPIQGEGGYVVPPDGFLKELRLLADRHGILLILDEIQTGFGRTGDWFAAQVFGVEPDIMAIAKGIANGFPLSATAAPRDLMRRWEAGAHGTTFGGSPIACAAGLAVLQVMREEGVLENCRRQGAYALERLRDLQARSSVIGDVRGKGLMIGVEFVRPEAGEPAPDVARRVVKRALEDGLLLYPCGLHSETVRLIPPLTIGRQELDEGLEVFERSVLEAG